MNSRLGVTATAKRDDGFKLVRQPFSGVDRRHIRRLADQTAPWSHVPLFHREPLGCQLAEFEQRNHYGDKSSDARARGTGWSPLSRKN